MYITVIHCKNMYFDIAGGVGLYRNVDTFRFVVHKIFRRTCLDVSFWACRVTIDR